MKSLNHLENRKVSKAASRARTNTGKSNALHLFTLAITCLPRREIAEGAGRGGMGEAMVRGRAGRGKVVNKAFHCIYKSATTKIIHIYASMFLVCFWGGEARAS